MEVTISPISEVLHEAEILVTRAELKPMFEQAYDKERARLEIKGFRKGKAPISLVKKMYGEAIEHDALDDIANECYRRAMDERSIRPIGQPSMVDMDYRPGAEFRFKIQYEIRPEIILKQYKGIAVEKPIHRLTEAEIDNEILRLRRQNSKLTEVDTVTDSEHIVTGDLQELDAGGTPLIGRNARGMRFYLTDESLSPEIRQALEHASAGSTYRTRIESQGKSDPKPVDLMITVTKIEKVELPAFDDLFVSTITKGTTASAVAFRNNLRADMERYWSEWSERRLGDTIAGEIIRMHEFPVPESLVQTILDSMIEDVRERSKDRSLPKDFDEKQFRDTSRAIAIWQAKWILLKERIAEEERISVTDDEVRQLAESDAGRLGIEKEKLVRYYRESSGVRDRLLTDKILKFLVGHANVSERIVEEQ